MGNQTSISESDVSTVDAEHEQQKLQQIITAKEIAQFEKQVSSKLSGVKCLETLPTLVMKDLLASVMDKDCIKRCYLSLEGENLVEYLGNLFTILDHDENKAHNSVFYKSFKLLDVIKEFKQTTYLQIPQNKVLKVRLVLIQTPEDYSSMNVVDLFSPLIDNFASASPSQSFRILSSNPNYAYNPVTNENMKIVSALAIGPFILYFNSLGLVIPKRAIGEAAFVLSEIEPLACISINDEAIARLVNIIFEWNCVRRYSKQTMNAQHFVDTICKSFSIPFQERSPSLSEYLQNIRTNGTSDSTITFSPEFKTQFKMKRSEKTFTNRNDLLVFCSKLAQRKFSKESYPDEWNLLKNLDRMYWCEQRQRCKYVSLLESDSIQPPENQEQVPNPFNDPDVLLEEKKNKSKNSWF